MGAARFIFRPWGRYYEGGIYSAPLQHWWLTECEAIDPTEYIKRCEKLERNRY